MTGCELACDFFDNVFKRVVGKVIWIIVGMKKIFKEIYKKLTSLEYFAIPELPIRGMECLSNYQQQMNIDI